MPRVGLDSEAVVETAAELADARGLQALTLAALADRLGIRAPSLYAHVTGMEDLRNRLAAYGAAQLTVALSQAVAGRAGADALRALADTYRAYAHEHPGAYAAIQRAPDDPASLHGYAARELVSVIVAALSGYGLEGNDAIHAVRIVRAALHGFVTLEQIGGFAMDVPVDESYARAVRMLDRALATR
jgi:AcrR family transcriptional regulator